jgi:hypothetical protein
MGRTQVLGFLSSEVVWISVEKDECLRHLLMSECTCSPKKKRRTTIYEVANMMGISLVLILLKDNLYMVWTATKCMPMWGTRRIMRTCARIFTKVSMKPRNPFKR